MLHVIVYDIANPRRLNRVALICEDFGRRVEKSVFECDLDKENHDRLWRRLWNVIDESEDMIVDYPVGHSELSKIVAVGVDRHEHTGVCVF